eukprot:317970-Pelagomonas_calceolata.AAC.1
MYQKLTGYPWIVLILPSHYVPTNTSCQTLGKRNSNNFPLTHIIVHTSALRLGQLSYLRAWQAANYKKMSTPKIKDWKEITYADGS